MAAKTYYIVAGADGNFGAMVDGTAQAAATRTDGWTVAKTASGNSSEFDNGTKQASGSFSSQTTTPKPASFLTGATANAFKTPAALTGIFDHATSWVFTFAVRATTASSQAGRMRMRVFRSVNADGSGATEITGATQVGTTSSALSTSADVTSAVTWTPGADVVLNNEYLFFVIAWEITTASGSNNGDVQIRTGSTGPAGSRLVTPSFSITKAIPPAGISATSTVSGRIPGKRPITPAAVSATSTVSGAVSGIAFASAGYETGTAGNALATSDTGDATAFTSITIDPSDSLVYDANPLASAGSLSAKHVVVGGGSFASYWTWTISARTQFYMRGYFEINSLVAAEMFSGNQWAIRVNSSGLIELTRGALSTLTATGTVAVSANSPFRIEAYIDHVAGAITCKLYLTPESTTPDDTISFTGFTGGTGLGTNTTTISVGPTGQVGASAITMWSDAIKANVGAWIGPVGSAAGPKAITPAAISVTSVVSGSIVVKRVITSVAISATSIVSGALGALRKISPAQISATSTVSGTVTRAKPITPTAISATSIVAGAIRVLRRILPGQISATSIVSGSVRVLRRVAGGIAATSTVSGTVTALRRITPTQISATSTVSGTVVALRRLSPGQISAFSVVSGSIGRRRPIAGAILATSTLSGRVTALHRIIPAGIAATSIVSGTLTKQQPGKFFAGNVAATSVVSGSVRKLARIGGAVSAVSTVSGALRAARRVTGAITALSVVSGSIRVARRIAGVIAATSVVSGSIIARRRILPGQISATSVVSGSIIRGPVRPVAGVISATSTVSGSIVVFRRIQPGAIQALSVVSGSITAVEHAQLGGAIAATSTVSGTIRLLLTIYGKTTPRITSARYTPAELVSSSSMQARLTSGTMEDAQLTSGDDPEIPIIERAK